LVDDDVALLKTLEAILVHNGFDVSAVSSVPAALELISTRKFDVLLADLNVGQPGDGFTVVSAMRRVQPEASTFILTGYPDFESAIKAIRNQVDDYFSKPLDMGEFLRTISAVQSGNRVRVHTTAEENVSTMIRGRVPEICERWLQEVLVDSDLAALPLTKAERTDHIPDLLRELATRLENQSFELSPAAAEAARKHGRTRHQQGYTIPQILFETRVLQKILCEFIQENLLNIELSTLVRDILQVGQNLQAELEVSIREYQAQIPRSLQTSFSMLYNSRYLGVAILDDHRITDANDAMLRMIGRTREQVSAGEINWQEMTPEQFRPVDAAAIEQLREFGACAPYEKNFVLPDGSSLPFLIGAVRLTLEPLEWSAYVVDLTEQRRVGAAEQKLRESEAKYTLINQLAHEINNPLAALMFSTHLLGTHPALTDDMRLLLGEIGEMLSRVTDTVRRVLAESQK
jgi:PAS domain S-box-containing protein